MTNEIDLQTRIITNDADNSKQFSFEVEERIALKEESGENEQTAFIAAVREIRKQWSENGQATA